MSIVLVGTVDHVSKNGKARGNVIYFHNGKHRKLATVYGNNVAEMRRNKWTIQPILADAYEELWYERGNKILTTDTMRQAMRVLRVLGRRTFSLVVCKSTIRALFKRGIINADLSINRYSPRAVAGKE